MKKFNRLILFVGILTLYGNLYSQKWTNCDKTNSLFEIPIYNPPKIVYFDLDSLKQVFLKNKPAHTYNKCSGYQFLYEHPTGFWRYHEFSTKAEYKDAQIYYENGETVISRANHDPIRINHPLSVNLFLDSTADYHIFSFEEYFILATKFQHGPFKIQQFNNEFKLIKSTNFEDLSTIRQVEEYSLYEPCFTFQTYLPPNYLLFGGNECTKKGEHLLFNMYTFQFEKLPIDFVSSYVLNETGEQMVGWIRNNGDTLVYVDHVTGKIYQMPREETYPWELYQGVIKDSLLVIAWYPMSSEGVDVACYDLKKQSLVWKGDVKKVSVSHSAYDNNSYLSLYKDRVVVYGDEGYIESLQIFDLYTGKRLMRFFAYWKYNPVEDKYEPVEEID